MHYLQNKDGNRVVFTTGDLIFFIATVAFVFAAFNDGSTSHWLIEGGLIVWFIQKYVAPFISFMRGDKDISEPLLSYSFQEYCGRRFPRQWNEYEHIFCDLTNLKEWRLQKSDSRCKAYIYYYFSLVVTYTSFAIAICLSSAKRYCLLAKIDS